MKLTTSLWRRAIRETALEHEGTVEREEGDALVYEVKGQPYASLARDPRKLEASFYLPDITANALTFPDTTPTPGPGRDRWVTVRPRRADLQVELYMTWVVEAYHAVSEPGRRRQSREAFLQARRAKSRR